MGAPSETSPESRYSTATRLPALAADEVGHPRGPAEGLELLRQPEPGIDLADLEVVGQEPRVDVGRVISVRWTSWPSIDHSRGSVHAATMRAKAVRARGDQRWGRILSPCSRGSDSPRT